MKKAILQTKKLVNNQIKLANPISPLFFDTNETIVYFTPKLGKYYFISEEKYFTHKCLDFKYQIFIHKVYAGTMEFFKKIIIPYTYEEAMLHLDTNDAAQASSSLIINSNKDYINSCIKQRREYFFAGIITYMNTPWGGLENENIPLEGVREALLSLVDPNISIRTDGNEVIPITKYLENNLWQDIDAYEPFRLIGYDDYRNRIRLIRDFITKICFKRGSEEEKRREYAVLNEIQNYANPLSEGISFIIAMIGDYLRKSGEIKRCAYCGTPFIFKAEKIYCSDPCRKKTNYLRDYERHYEKRRARNNEGLKEHRKFLKERGVVKLTKEEQQEKIKKEKQLANIEEKLGVLKN